MKSLFSHRNRTFPNTKKKKKLGRNVYPSVKMLEKSFGKFRAPKASRKNGDDIIDDITSHNLNIDFSQNWWVKKCSKHF